MNMSEHLHPGPDTLSAFLEGMLPEHERAVCLAHLAECPSCREILFQAAPVPVPMPIRPRMFRAMSLLAAAAALCFALLGIWLYLRSKTEAPPHEQAAQVRPAPVERPIEAPIAREIAPQVPHRRPSKPAPPLPSPPPVAAPEVARAAPPRESIDSAAVEVRPAEPPVLVLPSPPPTIVQTQVAPVDAPSGISGIVTDSTGAVIPRAGVELRQLANNAKSNAQTDDAGQFRFTGLVPGQYELRISRAGFMVLSQRVEVKAQEMASVKSALQVGSTAETVEVMAESSTIQTASASVSNSRRKEPRPLPSKLPPDTTVAHGKVMLTLDSAGTLFVSGNQGKSWKAVKPQWTGKITDLIAPPDVPEPGKAQFQLTTESGADWLSRDGRRWHPAPPQK